MGKDQNELLREVLDARQEVDRLDALLSKAKEVKEQSEAALVEQMDADEIKSFKSTVYNVNCTRTEQLYVSIDKEKKEEAFRYIEEDLGRGDALKLNIHNKTLSSIIGEMLKKGEHVPQELFKYFFKPSITITVSK